MKLWKIQKFFGDVVYDLRTRGMLPIVVLLLVAMVAIPLLIASGGSSSSSPSPSQSVIEEAAELAPENQKAVVAYQPGVRDYKERLKDLTAKDPFKQQFTQAAAAASQLSTSLGGTSGSTGGGTSTSTSDTTSEGTTGTTGGDTGTETAPTGSTKGGGGGGSGGGKTTVRYFYYTTDLLVGESAWTLQRRNGVKALTPLPSDLVPVAIYLGATLDGKQALFLLSNEVTQVTGQGQCLPSPTDCSMLSLRANQASDMLYGTDGKTYRIKVLRTRRIVSSKPPR